MRLVTDKENCTGCGACLNACSRDAIEMVVSEDEGCVYPYIDDAKCIQCGLCEQVCCRRETNGNRRMESYIARAKQSDMLAESTSGGVFAVIAEQVIRLGGSVWGAILTDELYVKHIRATNIEKLQKIKKSKYVQSGLDKIFVDIKRELDADEMVLFSGLPCQIAGLRAFLGKTYSNLLLVDVICHGVPGEGIWREYLNYMEDENQKIVSFEFRSKDNGWDQLFVKYKTESGKVVKKESLEDLYMSGFYRNITLRESCYNCKFKGDNYCSDITLGDCWGYESITGNENDNKGMSVVLLNTSNGQKFMEYIMDDLVIVSAITESQLKMHNRRLFTSVEKPVAREKFLRLFESQQYKKAFENLKRKDRNKMYIDTLSQWLRMKISNPFFVREYFEKNSINKIAVYGMGTLGECLCEELLSSGMQIEFCIDNSYPKLYRDCIQVVSVNDLDSNMSDKIDCIIVTPIHVYEEIAANLSEGFEGKIISLTDMITKL